MVELNCKYPVVYKDDVIVYTPDKDGAVGSTYPGAGTSYKEFDTYEDAQAFIKKQGLKEPKTSDSVNYEVQG